MRAAAPFAPREGIPGDSPVVRVFVSSTWYDLEPERQAVETALGRLAETKFAGMEHFGSREEGSLDVSLEEVDKADLYVGILAGRYGSGITEAEYQRARRRGLDCLIYHKKEPTWVEDDLAQRERLQRFRKETERHKHTTFTTPDDLAARVTADLHRWLVDNVLIPRLRKAGFTEALADAYLPPWPVFERLDLDRFTGRLWLTAEVDRFLEAHDRGYFILEADAGLGKSAFLAHLVRERRWIHHFVELARGQDGIRHGVRNLAAQIALTWEPEHAGSLEDVTRSDLLQNLLREAAERRDQISPGAKIVLVVDGLDESAALPQQNVMGLPRVLPAGVYFVVSQRPVQVILETEAPRQLVPLRSDETRNLDDMRAFLLRVAQGERVAAVLAESSIPPDDFVSTLLERSQGVWIYLHYILEELERGERRPLDLQTLPRGLWEYYAGRWRRRRDGQDWTTVELPLLAVLAAAQEELPARLLCAFAGLSETPQVTRLLREDFRPFLATSVTDERRYRCYHASFREFLEGRADRSRLTAWEEAMADELAEATRAAHNRITDGALEAWGGLENGLPRLNDPARRDLDGGYALRHVVAHLEGAGRLADLSRLLRAESPQGENVWFAVHERTKDLAGYLSDVVRAWRAADAAAQAAIDRGEPAVTVALQARCTLLLASVRSLASRVGPSMLAALVEKGIWEPKHALTYAREIPEAQARFLAMVYLILVLPEAIRKTAVDEAVAAARWASGATFEALPPGLPDELLAAFARQDLSEPSWRRVERLVALVPRLPANLLPEILSWLRAIDISHDCIELLAALVPLTHAAEREELLQMARQCAEPRWLWKTGSLLILLRFASFLPLEEQAGLAREALEHARTSREDADPLLFIRTLPILQQKEREIVAREALEATLALSSHEADKVLKELIPQLPPKLLKVVEKRALQGFWDWKNLRLLTPHWRGQPRRIETAFARVEKHWWQRSEALAALAPVLPDALIERALHSALESHEPVVAVDALAPRLSRSQLERALARLLEAGVSSDIDPRPETIEELVARLASDGSRKLIHRHADVETQDVQEAEAVILKERWDRHKAEDLVRLAATAPSGERQRLLDQALQFSHRVRYPLSHAYVLFASALLSNEPERQRLQKEALEQVRSRVIGRYTNDAVSNVLLLMARHLHEPLLREALACVGAFERERDIAPIFRKLIPRLPEAQAAEALLLDPYGWSVLTHANERAGRPAFSAGWLGRLCGRAWVLLPPSARSTWIARKTMSVLTEALPSLAGAKALVGMALASPRFKDQGWVLIEALSSTGRLRSPSARAELLTDLLAALKGTEKGKTAGRALAAALALPDPAARSEALERLAPWFHPYFRTRLHRTAACLRHSLPAGELTDAGALEALRETASVDVLLDRLEHLAEEDRAPLLAEARQIAENLEIPALQGWTHLQLVPFLSAQEGEEVVRRWSSDSYLNDTIPYLIERWGRRRSPCAEPVLRALLEVPSVTDLRSEILVAAAPHLPEAVLHDAFMKAWSIDSLANRSRALEALASRLVSLPAADLFPLWQEAMERVAGGTRESAISDVEALLPVLERLGGRRALENLFGLSDLE